MCNLTKYMRFIGQENSYAHSEIEFGFKYLRRIAMNFVTNTNITAWLFMKFYHDSLLQNSGCMYYVNSITIINPRAKVECHDVASIVKTFLTFVVW